LQELARQDEGSSKQQIHPHAEVRSILRASKHAPQATCHHHQPFPNHVTKVGVNAALQKPGQIAENLNQISAKMDFVYVCRAGCSHTTDNVGDEKSGAQPPLKKRQHHTIGDASKDVKQNRGPPPGKKESRLHWWDNAGGFCFDAHCCRACSNNLKRQHDNH
jgi:hypothetical protein